MNRKLSLPCALCSKSKDCSESFLCSTAFGIRIGLSLVAAAGLVVAMSVVYPKVFSTLSPDSYSVTGHPMDRVDITEGSAGSPARAAGGEPAGLKKVPVEGLSARDS